ncbi:MAG: hypothetical protein AAF357_16730 [Verrucomicrobiota bacterium]
MRRLFLCFLLPQIFLALSVGSAVTTCQAAWVFGIDLHASEHSHSDHGHHHHHSHDEEHEKTPCGSECSSLLSEVTAPAMVKVPDELDPIEIPPLALLFEDIPENLLSTKRIPAEPPAHSPPPSPVLTGCFLI